ncbi:PEP-CTERM protein-sorting domain-containing protein [Duganella sp. CF402]|uniref:CHRD domain-containing protein n=1 Tax=unclassified Duganella TaxID=2636909 RepID=UPI0008C3D260|nr:MULTISPECIES: CHRD domain-containing protein [unclassified Duganella]RZT09601.1 putative secreted protein with PEP-CTERM sorting signal [Duganella sp. BK701]SEL50592.1 PEP-CTERM protein-sorting domain-containing protein [Duganella sp. CF402]
MKPNICNWAAAGLLLAATASASATTYTTILTGAKEATPNTSDAIGAAAVTFDAGTHVLEISTAFAGLLGNSTAAHIHCCTTAPGTGTAGPVTEIPAFTGFPLGVQTGAYSHSYDTSLASSWNAAFLSAYGGSTSGAEAALLAGLNAGSAYLNIHSSAYPDGEIRGFLTSPTAVPEPASFAMLGLGLPAVLMMARRRRKST